MILFMRGSYKIVLLLIISLLGCSAATVAPTWSGTTYIQAGTRIIVLNSAAQNSSNLYIHSYSPAFTSSPFTALGLVGFQTTNLYEYLLKFWVNIADYNSLTQMKINMTSPTATSWRQFRVSYIAIDAIFTQLKVDYFYQSSLTNVSTGTGPRSFYGVFTLNIGSVDVTHKISIIPLLIGIESRAVNGQHCVYWDTKLRNANSINYNLTVDRTTQISFFTSYILVVDRTLASNTLQIFMDELYIGGSDNTPVYQTPVYYNLTNLHAGLNSFRFQLVAFNFDKNSFLLSSLGYYKFMNISIWSYRQRTCNPSYPYYELNTNLCYDTCPAGYVNTNGNTQKYCKACGDFVTACQFCSATGSACTTCYGNYVVSGSSCNCPNGYYISTAYSSYADKCRPCDNSCLTCTGPSSSQCASCASGKTLSSGSCICPFGTSPSGTCLTSCQDQGCQSCPTNTSLCQTCHSPFILSGARCICGANNYFDLSLATCNACHYSCQYCTGPSSTECSSCSSANFRYLDSSTNQCKCQQGYTENSNQCIIDNSSSCTMPGYGVNPQNSQCQQVCGDTIIINAACDDGNSQNGDGCSSTCSIESGFVCSNNPLAPNTRSFCSYAGNINLRINSTIKDIYSNKIFMNFTLEPNIGYILKDYPDLTQNLVLTPSQYQMGIIKANYNTASQFLQVQASYGQNVQDQNITITLTMPIHALTYAIPVSSSIIQIKPKNKLSASHHSQQTYGNVVVYKIIGMVCYIGGLCAVIVLSFFRKMIGLEYITMLQFVYFSIMLSPYIHPYLGSLLEWQFINGYNDVKTNLQSTRVTNDFQVYQYQDYFFVNANAMIFVCLVNYALALILYCLSLISDRTTSRKLKTSALFFAVQLGFTLIIFSLNNIIISIFLEAVYGHIFDFSQGLDKFFIILTILMLIAQIILYFKNIHDLNDSQFYYHRHKAHTHFFPFIFLIRNLVIIIAIVIVSYVNNVSSYIGLGIQVVYIIATFAVRPFKRIVDYIRFFIVQVTLTLILVCHLIQTNFITNYSQMDSSMSSFFEISAICIIICMLCGFVMTLISFVYHFWKSRTQDTQVNPDDSKNQADHYVPPVKLSNTKNNLKVDEPQKSKQILVYDLEQGQDETGEPSKMNQSQKIQFYDQSSKRKLRSKKISRNEKDFD